MHVPRWLFCLGACFVAIHPGLVSPSAIGVGKSGLRFRERREESSIAFVPASLAALQHMRRSTLGCGDAKLLLGIAVAPLSALVPLERHANEASKRGHLYGCTRRQALRCAAGEVKKPSNAAMAQVRGGLAAASYSVLDIVGAAALTKQIEGLAGNKQYEKMSEILTEPDTINKLGPSEVLRLWKLVPESALDMAEAYIESCRRVGGRDRLHAAGMMCEAAEFLGVSACFHGEAMSILDQAKTLIEGGKEDDDTRRNEIMCVYLSVLASVRGSMGEYAAAREALQKNLKLKEKLGADTEDVAAIVVALAGLARQCGQLDEAMLLCRRAEKIAQENQDDGVRAITMSELAAIHQEKGEYDKALVESMNVLEFYQKKLGPEHPSTASAMDALGVVYQKLGQYEQARKLHMSALAVKEATLGATHIDVAPTLQNLGVCADEGDADYQRGREWKEKALTILSESLPPIHPQVGTSLMSLGESARAVGDLEVAQNYFEQACQIFRASLGNSHPLLAAALNNLAQVHRVQRRYDESLLLMEQSVSIKKEAFSQTHPSIATGLSNLAAIWEEGYKDLDRSLELRRQALNIIRNSLGEEHPQYAVHANNLGVLLSRRGDYEEATVLYEEALAIDEATYGKDHPQVATDLNNLATLSFHVGQWQLSKSMYQRALAIREKVFGGGHTKTEATRKNLALVQSQIDDKEQGHGGQ